MLGSVKKLINCPVTCPSCNHVFDPKPRRVWVVKCWICGVDFESKTYGSRYCSWKCYRKKENIIQGRKRKYQARKQRDPEFLKRAAEKQRAQHRFKYKTDPVYRVKCNLRARARKLIQIGGLSRSKLIGCSGSELKAHLESLFYDGMTWENYGVFWVVDHKQPISSFDLRTVEGCQKACNFTNLQPLTRAHNQEKAASTKWTRPIVKPNESG